MQPACICCVFGLCDLDGVAMTAFEHNAERVECFRCGGSGMDHDRGLCSAEKIHTCTRCQGTGTVLADKPCSGCAGRGCEYTTYGVPIDGSACMYCNGSGVEHRDKRMERLMREAGVSAEGPFSGYGDWHLVGVTLFEQGMDLKRMALELSDVSLCEMDRIEAFTGWCVADWQMRKDGQG